MKPTLAMAWIALAVLIAGTAPASAQKSRDIQPAPAAARPAGPPANPYPNSWALVIGIDRYQRVPGLAYAVSDAKSVADALPPFGFPKQNIRVLLDEQATKSRIERVLYEDFAGMGPDDRLFVFFAGHGDTLPIRGGEEGYLLPVDADPGKLPLTAIPMDDVRRIAQRLNGKHYLFVMDACFSGFAVTRDVTPSRTTDEYLASALREPVVQVLTAGRKGERAIEEGGHGLFTRRLLDGLRGLADPDNKGIITVAQLATWIEPRVVRDSKGRMTPQYGKLDGEGQFVFVRPMPTEPTITREAVREFGSLAIRGRIPGIEVWLGDKKIGDTEAGTALVVGNLAVGTYKIRAQKAGHKDWQRDVQVNANRRSEVMINIEALGPAKSTRGEDDAEMVLVPANQFWMGSDATEVQQFVEACPKALNLAERVCRERGDRETPLHRVRLDAYYIDQYEVTVALFTKFVAATGHKTVAEQNGWSSVYQPKEGGGWHSVKIEGADWRRPGGPNTTTEPTLPVVHVAWADADTYCRWAGKRLPTEAEWERAARGPHGRTYPWGKDFDQGKVNSGMTNKRVLPVGSYPAGVSPYGVHDMSGNVWEWVRDGFDKDYYGKSPERNPNGPEQATQKALRGGSWLNHRIYVASARRGMAPPDRHTDDIGFRCAKPASG
jgi:formylglycine-generating enzyme required for sulfatase activity